MICDSMENKLLSVSISEKTWIQVKNPFNRLHNGQSSTQLSLPFSTVERSMESWRSKGLWHIVNDNKGDLEWIVTSEEGEASESLSNSLWVYESQHSQTAALLLSYVQNRSIWCSSPLSSMFFTARQSSGHIWESPGELLNTGGWILETLTRSVLWADSLGVRN